MENDEQAEVSRGRSGRDHYSSCHCSCLSNGVAAQEKSINVKPKINIPFLFCFQLFMIPPILVKACANAKAENARVLFHSSALWLLLCF